MKLYKKKDLVYVDGMLVSESTNEVVAINCNIVNELNCLETEYQKALYLSKQAAYSPAPSLEDFKREHFYMEKLPVAPEPNTPVLDEKVEKGLALIKELDAKDETKKINQMIEMNRELFLFLSHDYVVDQGDGYKTFAFDTPRIGNPLELTQEDLVEVITFIIENGRF